MSALDEIPVKKPLLRLKFSKILGSEIEIFNQPALNNVWCLRNLIKSNQGNFVTFSDIVISNDLLERIQQEILNRFNDQLGADVEQCDNHQELILLFTFDTRDGLSVVVIYLSMRGIN